MTSNSLAECEEIWERAPEVAFDDLPQFDKWSARMLGLEAWEREERTPEDAEREYDREKYTPEYEYLLRHPEINQYHGLQQSGAYSQESVICTRKKRFRRFNNEEALQIHCKFIAEYVAAEMPAPALVELGAGDGRTILSMATDPRLQGTRLFALEKMNAGQKIIQEMAKRRGLSPIIGPCDLSEEVITSVSIPEGAVFFTSVVWFMLQTPARQLVDSLLRFKPKMVFHFEPFGCFYDLNSLYGQLCASYLRINKYNCANGNELKQLHGKSIEIVHEEFAVIGNNPFLPFSLIAWKPKKQ